MSGAIVQMGASHASSVYEIPGGGPALLNAAGGNTESVPFPLIEGGRRKRTRRGKKLLRKTRRRRRGGAYRKHTPGEKCDFQRSNPHDMQHLCVCKICGKTKNGGC